MLRMLKEYSILYVEDEPEVQRNIQEYLESYFKTVYVTSDGRSAHELYLACHPDVLLLDINLPYLDGLSLAQKIRRHDQDVKIVMLTAYTDNDKLLQATELKLTKYLIKPVTPKEFKEVMKLLCRELMQYSSRFLHLCEYYVWDKTFEMLSVEGNVIKLSDKEHRLLKLFISKQRKNISFEEIIVTLWDNGYEHHVSIESVKNQVSHLRKKLPKLCIENVYGQGYILK